MHLSRAYIALLSTFPSIILLIFAFSCLTYDGFEIAKKEEFYENRKVRNDNANKMYLNILEDESDGLYIRDIIRLEIKNNDTRIPRNISK